MKRVHMGGGVWKVFDDETGCRLTDCCQAYAKYCDFDLCCRACYKTVSFGEGDGNEHRETN